MRDSSLIDNDAVFTTSATTNEFGVATVTISQQLDPQEFELLDFKFEVGHNTSETEKTTFTFLFSLTLILVIVITLKRKR